MRQMIDKLTYVAKKEKKKIIFLTILAVAGIISGSIFTTILSKTDKVLVTDYIQKFITKIDTNKLNYLESFKSALTSNIIFIIIIWVLGISVIGIPINIFLYFVKTFILGFTISSFILTYKVKGCLLSLLYIFPHHLLNILIYMVLLLFSIHFSIRIIQALKSKKGVTFKLTFKRYVVILVFTFCMIMLTTAIETFITPFLIKKILFIIK